jgi:predicted nuclease of predicted toxin-antitoxin system
MLQKRPFLKHKLLLYFDENILDRVATHFKFAPAWSMKVKIITARELGTEGQSDKFHYNYCRRYNYTLVTLDLDFNNDNYYPFTSGKMPGIIMVKASSADAARIIDILSRTLDWLTRLPLPRAFLAESKLVAGRDGATMRGRDFATKEIKSFHVVAGVTQIMEIGKFFSF